MRALLIVLLHFVLLPGLLAQAYYEREEQLLAFLKTNYTVGARPNSKTHVTTTLLLFSLNKVDIGNEEMSVTGVMASSWDDPRLTWDASLVGIGSVISKTTDIWSPPLLIENNVQKVEILDEKAPLRIFSHGGVLWTPPFSPTTSCSADITYYPYDKQICNITLVGWSYTVDEVELVTNPKKPVDTEFYSENGEWELMSTGYHYFNLSETETGFTFRKLIFQLTVRRKWPYYGQNIMLPVVLNSFLMAVVFALPIDSGEKIGYCLTVLLSYIVLLTLVSANLPSISSQTSIIQMYLSVVMCLGTLSTMCTIGVLRLYHRDEGKNPVPGWMQTLAQSVLAPLVCRSCKQPRSVSPNDSETKTFARMKRIYSAKDIAEMIDSLFFAIFTVLIVTMTVTFISVLMAQY